MYLPRHFAEPDAEAMHALVRAHPLASVVLRGESLDAEHVPLVLRTGPDGARLCGHVPRTHPLAACESAGALAIFHGPEAYVSPSWYPAKAEHGRVVPTWNYAVVHAHGRLRRIEDRAWVLAQLRELTDLQETGAAPWHVDDAPADYLQCLLDALVGIELAVERLEGKFKLSQNQPPAARAGVLQGLAARAAPGDAALAALMAQREHGHA